MSRPRARVTALAGSATLLLALVPGTAYAHVFVGDGGPAAGFMHPLTGLDHLMAMFTVGVLSAQIGGRAVWTVPSAFVVMMVAGGILGATEGSWPGTELSVKASVVILGAAVAGGARTPAWSAFAAVGVFGLSHGYAHGREMPAAASPQLYALGFAVSTIGLHVLGVLTALLVLCRRRGPSRLRWLGAAISLVGACLVAAGGWPATGGARRPVEPPRTHALVRPDPTAAARRPGVTAPFVALRRQPDFRAFDSRPDGRDPGARGS